MKIYDISIPITNGMVTWPGDPPVELSYISEIKKGDEANISYLEMCVHTGTHIDAPKHFIDGGKTIESILMDKLIGEVLVVDINADVDVITAEVLQSHPKIDAIKKSKKILFHTRNSNYWSSSADKFYTNYVGIDASGAKYLTELAIDLVGVDYLSVAPFIDTLEPHQIFLSNEVVLLEGINLTSIEEGYYQLTCLPLNIPDCDGAPARAILMPLTR